MQLYAAQWVTFQTCVSLFINMVLLATLFDTITHLCEAKCELTLQTQ